MDKTQEALKMAIDGYWCIICQRFIEADEYGVIIHDDIDHGNMKFDEESNPQ